MYIRCLIVYCLYVALGFELVEEDSSSDEEDPLPDGWERRVVSTCTCMW